MQPVFGFLLYLSASVIVWIVASKRGRSGWIFFTACVVAGPILARLAYGASSSGNVAGFAAFLAPVIALIAVLAMPTSEQEAAATGSHGDFKKCPLCAESVRREAVKCKHCGSALQAAGFDAVAAVSAPAGIGSSSPTPMRPPSA